MRRAIAVVVLVALAALALTALGRWERARHADEQNRGIERVYSEVGAIDAPNLAGFRMLVRFQCLVYRVGGVKFALELCVDWQGRVVEAIDRRNGVGIWSLREDAASARVRVDRDQVERTIVRMCDDCEGIFERARLPGGQARR